MASDAGVQSLDRAFHLLGLVAAAGSERVGVSELARRSGLAKSTTARLVSSLRSLGALEDDGAGGGFRIGPTIGALTVGATGSPDLLRQLGRPILADLADVLGEHAALAISNGGDVLYIDQASASAAVDAGDWSGVRHPPHGAAAGKVLMLDWSRARLERYLRDSMTPNTEATITDAATMRSELEEVEGRGVAWSVDEFEDGVTGCAAPVVDPSGDTVAAIVAFAPGYRFPSDLGVAFVERELVQAAAELSSLLGDADVSD